MPYLKARLISVNDNPVLKGKMLWLTELFQNRIDKATLNSELIDSFEFNLGSHDVDYDVINGVIGRILMQDIHPEGFK